MLSISTESKSFYKGVCSYNTSPAEKCWQGTGECFIKNSPILRMDFVSMTTISPL